MYDFATRTDRRKGLSVFKFGGSSVGDVDALRRLVRVVVAEAGQSRLVLVVSALKGVTDGLTALAHGTAPGRSGLSALRERHLSLAAACLSPSTRRRYEAVLSRRLARLEGRLSSPREPSADCAFVLAAGERLSAPLVALALSEAGLPACAHDATTLIRVHDGPSGPVVDWRETRRAIRSWYAGVDALPVVTGFLAGTASGEVRTLGRGGSDYSAALLAAALRADVMDRWTDVDGLYAADPRENPNARRLHFLDMEEAHALNRSGRLGMHPAVFLPLLAEGIPLRVRCTRHPERHTLVLRSGRSAHDRSPATPSTLINQEYP
ncbi:amino acid kinase family protein [Rhodocaloribacter sp.]